MRWSLAACAASIVLGAAAEAEEVAIELREYAGVARRAWPAGGGVPLARGKMAQAGAVDAHFLEQSRPHDRPENARVERHALGLAAPAEGRTFAGCRPGVRAERVAAGLARLELPGSGPGRDGRRLAAALGACGGALTF